MQFGTPEIEINAVVEGDCRDLIPTLPKKSINLCLTSPPYAEQRKDQYPSVREEEYPEFTLAWMKALRPKLAEAASVLIVIDPHVRDGEMSNYVDRTVAAVRRTGWIQHRTLIWHKPDGLPLGRKDWPRHNYEQILWFSLGRRPYCAPTTVSTERDLSVGSFRHSKRMPERPSGRKGPARMTNVVRVAVGLNARHVDHPAKYPVALAERLIEAFCPRGGTVLDPFAGSGSTLIAARRLRRLYYGFDRVGRYCEISRTRLSALLAPKALAG